MQVKHRYRGAPQAEVDGTQRLGSNSIIIPEVRQHWFICAGGTRRPELVVIQSVGNCSYYSSSQQKYQLIG